MPNPVWRVEITWGPVINNPNNNPSLFLTTVDSSSGLVFAINVVRDNGAGNTAIQLFLSADEFGQGTFISGTSTLTGAGTGTYDSGGTLAFEKDYDADQFRFITPLGTETRTATSLSILNVTQLEIYSHGMAITRNPTNVDTSASVFWNNVYLKQDGTNVSGAELTDIDPGLWFAWDYTSSGGSGGDIPSDNAQTVTNYRSRLVYTQFSDNPKFTTTREARIWRGGNNITANPFRLLIDTMCHPISGELLWVRVPFEDHTTVMFGRSDDGGATLSESVIVTTGGDDYSYPTLAVDPNGRLWCFWRNENDRTQLYGSVSENSGRSWSTMVAQSFPGVASKTGSLRLRFHPISGVGLLVTRSLALTGLVVWVWDVGHPATQTLDSPFAIRDAGDSLATVYPTIAFGADGSTLVLGNIGNNRHMWKSENYGVSWSDFDNALVIDQNQPMMVGTTAQGLFAFLSQSATGDLFAVVSDNLLFQPPDGYTSAAVAAVSGAAQQYAALAVGPLGDYYMLYQEQVAGIYTVKCRRSDNWGRAWATP